MRAAFLNTIYQSVRLYQLIGPYSCHCAETLEDVQDGQGSASKLEADAQFEDQQNA